VDTYQLCDLVQVTKLLCVSALTNGVIAYSLIGLNQFIGATLHLKPEAVLGEGVLSEDRGREEPQLCQATSVTPRALVCPATVASTGVQAQPSWVRHTTQQLRPRGSHPFHQWVPCVPTPSSGPSETVALRRLLGPIQNPPLPQESQTLLQGAEQAGACRDQSASCPVPVMWKVGPLAA
jgi:hypothetical protein